MALSGVFWKPSAAAGTGPSLVSRRHSSWASVRLPRRSSPSSSATGGSVGIQLGPSLPRRPSKRPPFHQPPSLCRLTCQPRSPTPSPHSLPNGRKTEARTEQGGPSPSAESGVGATSRVAMPPRRPCHGLGAVARLPAGRVQFGHPKYVATLDRSLCPPCDVQKAH